MDALAAAVCTLLALAPSAYAAAVPARGLAPGPQAPAGAPPDLTPEERAAAGAAYEHLRRNPSYLAQSELRTMPSVHSVGRAPSPGVALPFGRGEPTYIVRFHPQRYNNSIPVEGTQIAVHVRGGRVQRVTGQWHTFQNVSVPASPRLSEQDVKRLLVGRELTQSQAVPSRPPRVVSQTVRIEARHLQEPGELVVLPIPGGASDPPAYRLTWRILVSSDLGWRLHVDSATGDILRSEYLRPPPLPPMAPRRSFQDRP